MCRSVLYSRELPSGLGDRLLVLVGAAAMLTHNDPCAVLHYRWMNGPHRVYGVSDVVTKLALPRGLQLSPPTPPAAIIWGKALWSGGRLPPTHGYDCVPELVPATFRGGVAQTSSAGTTPHSGFVEHYRAFASTIMPQVPPRQGYIAVHVRGTDKRGGFPDCLSETLRRLSVPLRVVTDDPALARTRLLGRAAANASDVFSDLAVILGASGIVMHSPGGWSAFSAMGAFFRGIPTLTTARDRWQLDLFRRAGATLDGWYECGQVHAFLAAARLV